MRTRTALIIGTAALMCSTSHIKPPALAQTSNGCWNWSNEQVETQKIAAIRTPLSQLETDYIGFKLSPELVANGQLSLFTVQKENSSPSNFTGSYPNLSLSDIGDGLRDHGGVQINIKDLRLLTNQAGNQTVLDMGDIKPSLAPGQTYEIITTLPKEPRREYVFFGDRYFVPTPEKVERKFQPPGKDFQTGNTDSGPYNTSSVLQRQAPPLSAASSGGSTGSGGNSSSTPHIDDALVQILIRTNKNQNTWGRCVGSHIGGGHVITARHCLNKNYDPEDYVFLFGDIKETPLGITHPKRRDHLNIHAELECSASSSPSNLGDLLFSETDTNGKYLDVAIIKVHADFSTALNASKFTDASLEYGSVVNSKTPFTTMEGPRFFSMATIWPENTPHNFAFHAQNNSTQPDVNSKVSFFPDFEETKKYNCQNHDFQKTMQGCAPKVIMGNQSSQYGWEMGCPTISGTSGSPIFESREDDQKQTRIIAIVSSEGKTNCAAPVWLKKQ